MIRTIDPMFFPACEAGRCTVSSVREFRRAQSGGLLLGLGLDQHPHNVTLFHDEVLDAIELDLGARPFAEQDAVADPNVDGDELAALVAATKAFTLSANFFGAPSRSISRKGAIITG